MYGDGGKGIGEMVEETIRSAVDRGEQLQSISLTISPELWRAVGGVVSVDE